MPKLLKGNFAVKILVVFLLIVGIGVIVVLPKLETYLEIKSIEQTNLKTIESSVLLEVPFICQAPLQTEENWKHHEESCEEAAILQTYLYVNNKTMTKEKANEEILKMEDWQIEHFGSHRDIYADEVKNLIKGYYNLKENDIEIIYDATLEDIRNRISSGYPVIVPIMGNILKNPYYPYPGYHMLVAIGYTKERIITNDNGTKRGANFSYDNQTFYDAMTAAGGDVVIIKTKTTNP